MTDHRVPPPPPDPSHLERYVLGLLDEPACEAIEDDAFGNPDVALAIDEAETRLVDAYVAGSLAPERQQAVERALARRPRLRERLHVARALAQGGTRARSRRWWLPLTAAAAVLVGVALWNARSLPPYVESPTLVQAEPRAGTSPPDQPVGPAQVGPAGPDTGATTGAPAAPAGTDAPRRPPRSLFAVTLPAGVSRSAAPTPVDVPPSSTHVELRVPIAEGDDFPRYRLRVSDARGQEVATASPTALLAGRTVSIAVERRVLVDGTYDVAVEGLDGQGTPEPLAFLQVRVTGRP